MAAKRLIFGAVGTILTALCCFTPILPTALSALGLSALLPFVYTDIVLLPMLAGFAVLTGYAIWVRWGR